MPAPPAYLCQGHCEPEQHSQQDAGRARQHGCEPEQHSQQDAGRARQHGITSAALLEYVTQELFATRAELTHLLESRHASLLWAMMETLELKQNLTIREGFAGGASTKQACATDPIQEDQRAHFRGHDSICEFTENEAASHEHCSAAAEDSAYERMPTASSGMPTVKCSSKGEVRWAGTQDPSVEFLGEAPCDTSDQAGESNATGSAALGLEDAYLATRPKPPSKISSNSSLFSSRTPEKKVKVRTSGVLLRNTNSRLRYLEKILGTAWFESTFALFIVSNALVMALEAQYLGIGYGHDVGFPGYADTRSSTWPWGKLAFKILYFFFGSAFTFEVLLKLTVLRLHFVNSFWNLFDGVIVGLWAVETLVQFQGNMKFLPVNPAILRLARLVRLLRLVRLVRTIQLFEVLRLLVGSLAASVNGLFWSFFFLFFLMMTFALLLGYVLEPYITDEAKPISDRQEMFAYFGTFSRSMLSMFELTLGNWVPLTRILNDKVTEWFCPALLTYHCVVAFAVITVIRGIFLHETFQVASHDDELMIMKKDRQIRKNIKKMQQLFLEADDSGDGYLSESEFNGIMQDVRVKTWLAAMEFEVRDAHLLFKLIDDSGDGDHRISAEELVRGFARLKGPARSIDLVTLMQRLEHSKMVPTESSFKRTLHS